MLGRKLKNGGMTLVEVLVSMFVLSIAAVTVITAFSMAAQINTKAKRQQSTEALMENMLEYAEAGGTDFKGWFHVGAADYSEPAPGVTPGPDEKVEELKNVQSGFQKYTVIVTTNTAPYVAGDSLHKSQKVIQFGGTGSNAVLIDASGTSNDAMVRDMFHSMHVSAVAVHNAEEDVREAECIDLGIPYVDNRWTEKSVTDVNAMIDREIWICSEAVSSDTFRLIGYLAYTVSDSLELGDDTIDRTYKIPLCTSEEFDKKDSSNPSAKYLTQIYLMYSTSLEADSSRGKDIRFWDPAGMLDVNLYLAKQLSALKDVSNAFDENLEAWFSSETQTDVIVSCKDPVTNTVQMPKVTLYSPLDITCDETTVIGSTVTLGEVNSLVAKDEEVRVVTVTIEIKDPDTGDVLAEKTVTRLQ